MRVSEAGGVVEMAGHQEQWNNHWVLPVGRNGSAPNNYHADESTLPGVIV